MTENVQRPWLKKGMNYGFIGFVFLLLTLIFLKLCLTLTWLGATAIYLGVAYLLGREGCRLTVFPGAFWFYQRLTESQKSNNICRYILNQLLLFRESIAAFCEVGFDLGQLSDLIQSTQDMQRIIMSIRKNTERQIGTLSRNQNTLAEIMEELFNLMNEATIIYEYEKFSLWGFPDKFGYSEDPTRPLFEDSPDNLKANSVITCCNRIEELLRPIAEPKSLFRKIMNYLFDKTLGTLNYMRVETQLRYKGENILIPSFDENLLDTMLLLADEEQSPEEAELGPTVVYFNPNACYYEYAIELQDQWIEFYRNMGLNVMLWNYRGYGRSQGYITPNNIQKDGEVIVEYLKKIKGVNRIILHGESLGGAVASHVADTCGCDLLFADRSFCDLDSVAKINIGGFVSKILQWITKWNLDATKAFLRANCYKIMGNDPADKMIGEIASLKTGISKAVINAIGKGRNHILSNNEAYVLYRNISDLYEMINDFRAQHKKAKKRRHDRHKSQDVENCSSAHIRTLSDSELDYNKEETASPAKDTARSVTSEKLAEMYTDFQVPPQYKKFMRTEDPEEVNLVCYLNKMKIIIHQLKENK